MIGQENFTQFQRAVLLQSFDTNWRDHLAALDYLRQGIPARLCPEAAQAGIQGEAFRAVPPADRIRSRPEVTRAMMVQVCLREDGRAAVAIERARCAEPGAHELCPPPRKPGRHEHRDDVDAGRSLTCPKVRAGRQRPLPFAVARARSSSFATQ